VTLDEGQPTERRIPWVSGGTGAPKQLPKDYTGNLDKCCTAMSPRELSRVQYACSREPQHTGQHAAGDGREILGEWH